MTVRAASDSVTSAVTSRVLELEPPVIPARTVPPFFGEPTAALADGEVPPEVLLLPQAAMTGLRLNAAPTAAAPMTTCRRVNRLSATMSYSRLLSSSLMVPP